MGLDIGTTKIVCMVGKMDEFGKIDRMSSEKVLEEYQEFILPKFSKMEGIKIAIDPGNGAAAGVASLLFEKMGVEVKTINNEPDGRFPNRPSEPSAKNLKGLSEMIENGNFDFSVVIRSIAYNSENNYLSFMVGGAITALSDPEKEYEECLLKAKAMLEVLSK